MDIDFGQVTQEDWDDPPAALLRLAGTEPSKLPAVPLDTTLTAQNAELQGLLQGLADDIAARAGVVRPGSREKLGRAVSVLALNLLRAAAILPGMCVGVPLRPGWYSGAPEARAAGLGYAAVAKQALPALEAMRLAEVVHKGFRPASGAGGERTRIWARRALLRRLEVGRPLFPWEIGRRRDLERIDLRDSAKRPVAFEETDLTRGMRAHLGAINAVLLRTLVDVRLPDGALAAAMAGRKGEGVDLGAVVLHRVFNNASLRAAAAGEEDALEGGRFYGAFWIGMPGWARARITIDGEATEEIDFSGLQPTMAYHLNGLEPPEEPYEVPGLRLGRDAAKLLLIAMLNARDRCIAPPEDYDPVAAGGSWQEAMRRMEARHAAIGGLFFAGAGLRLQYRDSRIAERVMLHFARRGEPCLPVHDSFIVRRRHGDELDAVMARAYAEEMGRRPRTKRAGADAVDDPELAAVLARGGGWAGYEARQEAWSRLRKERSDPAWEAQG